MSSGIMEKNLPVATELGEGDMVRIVTGGGNSKQIDASAIGGGGGAFVINFTESNNSWTVDKSWQDARDAIQNGTPAIGVIHFEDDPFGMYNIPLEISSLLFLANSEYYININWNSIYQVSGSQTIKAQCISGVWFSDGRIAILANEYTLQ